GPRLRRTINATGVVIHTNLGRAPLAREALERVNAVAGGYSNLEYDLGEGGRGSRQDHAAPILRRLTGAEAALVVNNNAAAVLLALAALAEGLRRHPLQRALRADKLTLAALEATLALYLDPELAAREVPVVRMLAEPLETIRARAQRLASLVGGDVEPTVGRVGGGALPLTELPSFACAVEEELAPRLRNAEPPVIGLVRDGRFLLDCRTIADDEVDEVANAVTACRS